MQCLGPDILVRPDALDLDETSSSADGSSVSEVISEPVLAEDQQAQRGRVTAFSCDEQDEFFCVGRDDGSVNIHDMNDGQIVRKAYKHSVTVDIVTVEWSMSRRFIASADDSGKVIAKRLKIKDDGKWAVFLLFDLRIPEAVTQLLFSHDETLLLISTESSDRVWDLKTKSELCKRRWESMTSRKWLNHPEDQSRLIWLGPGQLRIHTWAGLTHETVTGATMGIVDEEEEEQQYEEEEENEGEQLSMQRTISQPAASGIRPPHTTEDDESIMRMMQPSSRQYVL